MNLEKFLQRKFNGSKFRSLITSIEMFFSKKDENSSLEFDIYVKTSVEKVLDAIKRFYFYRQFLLADGRNKELPDAFVLSFFKNRNRTTVTVYYLKGGFRVKSEIYKT